MSRVVLLAAAIAASLFASGCSATAVLLPGDALLVSVETSGGMCPAGACGMRYEVRRDGTTTTAGQAPVRLDAATMGRLIEDVDRADWDAILARPFTGTCPTAFDGQELTYTFRTIRGPVTVASCTTQIDPGQEPFRTLDDALFAPGG
jgi:hypothetical protein